MSSIGTRIGTYSLHGMFGSALRTRASEINRDPNGPITIKNEVTFRNGEEQSIYWAAKKSACSCHSLRKEPGDA